jgi:tetratricopeptide (TPR) repeat protein
MHHTNKDITRARASLTAAIELANRRAPNVAIDPIILARAHLALAFLEKEQNNVVESERHIDRGLALVATWDQRSDDARYWRAIFLQHRADAAMRAGDPERAATSLVEIADLQAALAADHPNISKYPRERAYVLLLLTLATAGVGDSRLWVANTGELDRGEAAIREAIAILERQEAEDAENADLKLLLASFRTTLGLVIAKRSPVAALPIYTDALASYERIPASMRASAYGRENEFIAHCAAAHALALADRRAEALARADRGLELARGNAFNVAMCESLVAMAKRALGDAGGAASDLDEVLAVLRPMMDKPDTSALIGVVETLDRLATLRPDQRCTLQQEALQSFRARPSTTTYLRLRLAELERAAADCAVVDSR